MSAGQEQYVRFSVTDRVAYVTIDRPQAKNALTKEMYAAIRDACAEAERDDNVDVLVVQGSNGAFSTGGDLKQILEMLDPDPSKVIDYDDYVPFDTLRTVGKPTVALIDGLCMGGGLTLALMCDIRIASDRSRFAIPEAKVGIVDGNLPRLLREEVSPGWLRYWMFTGAPFPASEAFQAGLLSKVVPADQLDAALQKCLTELKSSSREAIKACKRILNEVRPVSRMTDAYISMMRPVVIERLKSFAKK